MSFECTTCGAAFTVPKPALDRYPGWTPKTCRSCRNGEGASAGRTTTRRRSASAEQDLPVDEVLARYHGGPTTGLFTDGAADPNPGPGGWGVVWVVDDEIRDEACGHEGHTTNNRMELVALIHGYRMLPGGEAATVYTDSNLAVNTITRWAKGWEAAGWKRKTGPIANLDLVQELYALATARPDVQLQWIKAHDGARWNEYADALATSYRRMRR